MRSKDPNTQVGACIVSEEHKILSMGYNGFPTGCSDDDFPWAREGEPLENKYFYTTHSELNAILNYRGGSLEGATMYVTLFPCNECAKAIIQAGIKRLVYDSDKYNGTPSTIASRKMLSAAGVDIQKYEHTGQDRHDPAVEKGLLEPPEMAAPFGVSKFQNIHLFLKQFLCQRVQGR